MKFQLFRLKEWLDAHIIHYLWLIPGEVTLIWSAVSAAIVNSIQKRGEKKYE